MGMKERMFTGELYYPNEESIFDEQLKKLDLLYEFNSTRPTEQKRRQALMKEMFAEVGENCYLEPPFHANWGGAHMHLGDSVYANFNFTAVALESRESGVSIPHEHLWKDTALGASFDTFYSERYLTTLRLKKLHDSLAGIPYEHIIILANTDNYGGGGIYNSYTLTAAHNSLCLPVTVHEFGHSFGGLGDEYFYDDQYEQFYFPGIEPWEQNLTTLADFGKKWYDMLPEGTPIPTPHAGLAGNDMEHIGVYEGGGYQSKGVYRAFMDCRMKTNNTERFCAVCERAIERVIIHHIKSLEQIHFNRK